MLELARRAAIGALALSLVGFVVALLLNLPAQFVSGTPDAEVGLAKAVLQGTAISAPVPPFAVLLLALWLTTTSGWRATTGKVLFALAGLAMVIGGFGEWSHGLPFDGADTVVFLLFNVVGLALSTTLLVTAVGSLVRPRGHAAAPA